MLLRCFPSFNSMFFRSFNASHSAQVLCEWHICFAGYRINLCTRLCSPSLCFSVKIRHYLPRFQSDPYEPIPVLNTASHWRCFGDQLCTPLHSLGVTKIFWEVDDWNFTTSNEHFNVVLGYGGEYRWFSYRTVLLIYHIYMYVVNSAEVQPWDVELPDFILFWSGASQDPKNSKIPKIRRTPSFRMYRRSSVIIDKRIISGWSKSALRSMTG